MEEFDELKSAVNDLRTTIYADLINPVTFTDGYTVDYKGDIVENSSYHWSGYVEIPSTADQIVINLSGIAITNNKIIALYDEDKAYISKIAVTTQDGVDAYVTLAQQFEPSDKKIAKYVVVSFLKAYGLQVWFSTKNVSLDEAYYRVDTDKPKFLNFDFLKASGENVYGAYGSAPNDLRGKFGITTVVTVNNQYTTLSTLGYKGIPVEDFSTADEIVKDYVYYNFLVRTKYDLAFNIPNTSYASDGTLVTNTMEYIRVIVDDYKDMPDTKSVTILCKFKSQYVGAGYRHRMLCVLYFHTPADYATFVSHYNGYQMFYLRRWATDTTNIKFDFSTSKSLHTYVGSQQQVSSSLRKLCLYGTSIEALNYIAYTGQLLGLYPNVGYFNYGNGGGGIIFNPTRDYSEREIHLKKCFSCTKAEKIAALEAIGVDPATVSETDLNTSYDQCLLGNLDADLYIIGTYGINDGGQPDAFVVSEEREFDRLTIYGAYNYVLRALYDAKPSARVLILGQHIFTWANTREINDIQKQVAEKWGIPFADWGNKMALNEITKTTYTGDGCHPNASGQERMGTWLYYYLKNNDEVMYKI